MKNLDEAIAELNKLDSSDRSWQENAVLKALEAIRCELEAIKRGSEKE